MLKYILPPIITKPTILKFFNKLLRKSKNINYEKNNYNRISLTLRALNKKNFDKINFLEIGSAGNNLFNCIPLKKINKIGVDPESGGTHRMTSDDFFKINKKKFDVIFIDGLHSYEQCQRDVINSLKFLKKNGIIFMHDMMPLDKFAASYPRDFLAVNAWNGDVWKVGVELSLSKNLNFIVVPIDHGVGILKKKKKYKYKILPDIKHKTIEDYYKKYFKKINKKNCEDALKFIDRA